MSVQLLKGTGNNAYLYQETTGSTAIGIDAADSDKFKIVAQATAGALLSGTPQFTIDPAVNGNITLDPNGTGDLIVSSLGRGVVQSDASGTLDSSEGTNGQLLISNSAGAPAWANILSADSSVTITNGANSIDLAVAGSFADSYTTDAGSAVPAAGVLTVAGGTNIATAGAGSTVTINFDGTLPVGSGGTGATTLTDHGVVLGSGTDPVTITAVGTNGQVLIGSTGADPAFATIASADGSVTFTLGPNTLDLSVDASASGAVTTITGNSGGALSPTAGNISIVTANATPQFVGAVSTQTIDFQLNNLVLGSSLPSLAGGLSNVGVGSAALAALTSGNQNTIVGYQAGTTLSSASNNTYIGYLAGTLTTTGSGNTYVGGNAGLSTSTGTSNTAVGQLALSQYTTGTGNAGANVAIGNSALGSLTTGVSNVALGTSAAEDLLTGESNLFLGGNAGSAYTSSESSNILVRNAGVIAESNTMRIGTTGSGAGQVNRAFVAGTYGITPAGAAHQTVIMDSSGQLGTTASGGGVVWSVETDAAVAGVVNHGYIANRAGLVTITLPTTAAVGSVIEVTGINTAVGWRIAQNAGETIYFGTSATTTGAGGYIESTAIRDSVKLVCVVANNDWSVLASIGNITIV